jgi:hypothetical protein
MFAGVISNIHRTHVLPGALGREVAINPDTIRPASREIVDASHFDITSPAMPASDDSNLASRSDAMTNE